MVQAGDRTNGHHCATVRKRFPFSRRCRLAGRHDSEPPGSPGCPPVRVAKAVLGVGWAFGLPCRWGLPVLRRVVLAPRLLTTGYGLLVLVKIALLAAPVPLWLRWRRRGSSGAGVSTAHRVRWFAFTAMALAPSLFLDAWTPVGSDESALANFMDDQPGRRRRGSRDPDSVAAQPVLACAGRSPADRLHAASISYATTMVGWPRAVRDGHLVEMARPEPTGRAALSHDLLSVAHRICGRLDHTWRGALPRSLRGVSRSRRTRRRSGGTRTATPTGRPHRPAPLDACRRRTFLVDIARHRWPGRKSS